MSQLEKARLDSLADAVTVAHVGPTSAFFTDRGVPFFRTGNVGDRKLILENLKQITLKFHQKLRKSTLKGGDIMVSRVVSDRITCAIVPPEFDGANCGNVIVIRPGKNIVSEYLTHLISTPESQSQLLKRQVGSAQAVVNTAVLKAWEISLPPIAEQKRIAAILDKAEELRGLRRKALGELDAIAQSIFLEMFGNPVPNSKQLPIHPVGDLTDCIVPGRDKPKSFSGEIPWITTDDLVSLGVTTHSPKSLGLTLAEINQVRARIIPKDSVILSCVGDLGIISIAGTDMVINQQLHSFQCGKDINNVFLMYCLFFQKTYMCLQASSTTVLYMNKSVCNSIPIFVPPISLQQEFARRVEAIEHLKTTHRESLAQLDALFTSLQHRAFRGEL